ncbi:MAG TPA: hypothetical protein VMN04_02535 [Thermoanaerobaculia bacterium]|nr:hypothetical protein [Thermoanaerobaculia bacterium]
MKTPRTLTPAQRAAALALRGKTVARVVLSPFAPSNGGELATDPAIYFTDGSCLRFVVQETEVGEYGVGLVYPARRRL